MKINKLIGLFLCAAMMFSLVGCKKPADTSSSVPDSSQGGQEITTQYEEIPEYPEYDQVDMQDYTVYYFDSVNGNDDNDGLSKTAAKQTVSAANRLIAKVTQAKPVAVLFKAGSAYNGTLKAERFTATKEKPLVISVYDATEDCKYATFTAAPNCVEVTAGNIRISSLECTSVAAERGIYVHTVKEGALENVVLYNNYLHDINFDFEAGLPASMQGKGLKPEDVDLSSVNVASVCPSNKYVYACSAIYFEAGTLKAVGPSWFENVWVDGNLIERVSRDGLFVTSNWVRRPGIDWGVNDYKTDDDGWYPSKNFNVINNKVSYTGGDGMVVLGVNGGFMQNNVCYHAQYLGRGSAYNVALWIHSCKNFVMQFNESAYTHKASGAGDGQGFDIDMGNVNILFQYNYAHHNEGGGILLCTKGKKMPVYDENGELVLDDEYNLPVMEYKAIWENVTIRNNVFADNGCAVFTFSDVLKDLKIVNNTIVLKGERANEKLTDVNGFFSGIPGKNWTFANNLCYLRNQRNIPFSFDHCQNISGEQNLFVENNLFYNFNSNIFDYVEAKNTLTVNPGLENVTAEDGIENAKKFIPTAREVLSGGKFLDEMNKYDFGKSDVSRVNYIGAFGKIK